MMRKVFKLCFSLTIGGVFFISCSNEELNTLEELSPEEIQNTVLVDDLSSDINNLLDDDDDVLFKEVNNKSSIDNCRTRTVDVDTTNETVTVTLDFGEGCLGKRGRELKGKILILYKKEVEGYSKQISFEDFFTDGHQVEGSKSITKIKENTNGNKEATHSIDVTITLASGEVLILEGTRVHEKIEGNITDSREDDVYLISGSRKFTNKNGLIFTSTIVKSLRREYSCKFIVSGVKEVSKDGIIHTLDFGSGECDDKVVLTDENGESKEITLRKK